MYSHNFSNNKKSCIGRVWIVSLQAWWRQTSLCISIIKLCQSNNYILKMLENCSALKGTFRNFILFSWLFVFKYVYLICLWLKKVFTLNAEVEWFVWYRRQISVNDLLYFTFPQLCTELRKKREEMKPKIQNVAKNVCSPFQRQGAYIHIGYSLWTTELLFAYFKWNPNVFKHSKNTESEECLIF